MTITKRLKISYALLVLIPFILSILSSSFIKTEFILIISRIKMSVQTDEFNTALYRTLGNEPDKLLEIPKLEELISYTSTPNDISCFIEIKNKIVASAGNNTEPKWRDFHEQRYLNYWIFNLNDGTRATIFFINSKYKTSVIPYPVFMWIIFYSLLISILTLITSKKITIPLAKLKQAAISIRDEDFDVDLSYSQVDEIKDVFTAFDEMRLRIKHNVEKQLAYERNRTELIANISHDLKTPITAIKGYVEGIVDGVANTPEKIERYHCTIYKKIMLLDALIENLFLSSKLELKTVPFHFQKLDMNLFIQDLLEEIKYDDPSIEIVYTKLDNNIFILGDPLQLQRVVHNIIGNSIKYSENKMCKIDISLEKINNFAQLSISDNGIGLTTENENQIFEQFYRSDPARSSTTEGSGLGLAISKQIVEAHKGVIFAKNNTPNRGLTITFSIPILGDKNE